PGILGEMLSAAFNVNAMLWRTSPSATELEEVTLEWLRQMIGLPDEFKGVIYDTASISTLCAIAAAREAAGLEVREQGLGAAGAKAYGCMWTQLMAVQRQWCPRCDGCWKEATAPTRWW